MSLQQYRTLLLLLLLPGFVALFAGCSNSLKELENYSAEQAFEQGRSYYEEGNYKKALQYFLYVKDTFIRSPYAGPTRFYAGEAYFALEQYEEAAIEYTSFLSFFPDDPNAVVAQYKIGVSYFKQSLGPERDQSMLHTALEELEKVRRNYPDQTAYIRQAEEAILDVKNELALHEYLVAEFYRKEENYDASTNRLDYLIDEFPNADLVGDAVFLSGLNFLELEQPEEAKARFLTLLTHYPENEHIAQAQEHLTRLGVSDFPEPRVKPQEETQKAGIVLRHDGNLVFTDLLREDGVAEGMILEVYRNSAFIGTIRILDIQEKFSIGQIESLSSGKSIQQNDTVRLPY